MSITRFNPKIITFILIVLIFNLNKKETVFGGQDGPFSNSKNSVTVSSEYAHRDYISYYLAGYYETDDDAGIYLETTDNDDGREYPRQIRYAFLQLKNPDNELHITKINNYLRKEAQKLIDKGNILVISHERFEKTKYNSHYFCQSRLMGNDKYRVSVEVYDYDKDSSKTVTFNGAGDVLTLGDIFKVSKEEYLERLFNICFETSLALTEFHSEDLSRLLYMYDSEEDFGELKNSILNDFNYCMEYDRWKIGTNSITFYFTDSKVDFIFEIPFTELSDILEDGYAAEHVDTYRVKVNPEDLINVKVENFHPYDKDYGLTGYYAVDDEAEIYLLENRGEIPNKYSITKSFLQFKNPYNDLTIKKINNAIKKIAQEYIDSGEYRKIGLNDYQSIENGDRKNKSYLLQNDRNRVVVATNEKFPYEITTFNGAGDELTFGDIFKVYKQVYLDRLYDICFEAIVKYEQNQFADESPEIKAKRTNAIKISIKIENNWKIGRNSITIYPNIIFNNNTNAYKVEIPFSSLADIIEDEYLN